jgi:hypothetical protein
VRDAAVECLEEVYRVYGEALVDVISSHALRPAHLNAIYSRLAQMGADVAAAAAAGQAAEGEYSSSGGGAHAGHEDYDTASSDAAAAAGGGLAASHSRGDAGASTAAAADGGVHLEAGRSWGSNLTARGVAAAAATPVAAVSAAAAPAAAPRAAKRGGYKVCGWVWCVSATGGA